MFLRPKPLDQRLKVILGPLGPDAGARARLVLDERAGSRPRSDRPPPVSSTSAARSTMLSRSETRMRSPEVCASGWRWHLASKVRNGHRVGVAHRDEMGRGQHEGDLGAGRPALGGAVDHHRRHHEGAVAPRRAAPIPRSRPSPGGSEPASPSRASTARSSSREGSRRSIHSTSARRAGSVGADAPGERGGPGAGRRKVIIGQFQRGRISPAPGFGGGA